MLFTDKQNHDQDGGRNGECWYFCEFTDVRGQGRQKTVCQRTEGTPVKYALLLLNPLCCDWHQFNLASCYRGKFHGVNYQLPVVPKQLQPDYLSSHVMLLS